MSKKPKINSVKISDLTPDDKNANRHTERGEYGVRKSMEKFGYLEAGVLDADNRLIAGNKRTEIAADVLETEEAIVIEVDGTKPVYIKRNDLDLDTPEGREAALALNRTAQMSIDFDPQQLIEFEEIQVDLSDWWHDDELEEMRAQAEGAEIDLNDFFERVNEEDENKILTSKIVLEYTEEDYEKVIEAFAELDGTKEKILWGFLDLE